MRVTVEVRARGSESVVTVTELVVGVRGGARIVEGIDYELRQGEILGLVGESGSGKTTTALALLGFARAGMRIESGSVRVAGEELIGKSEAELRRLRGRLVSYVPQDPGVALNPSHRIGDQIAEKLRVHFPNRDRRTAIEDALERVRLPSDRGFQRRFPHQLSGGQQQRATIAIALIGDPPLVVLDEPTTGLDLITQGQILDEITRIQRELGTTMVYVSHNLAAVSVIADRIAVMYAGRIVEEGPAHSLLEEPKHPYTRGLIASIPDHAKPRRLRGIPGIAVGVHDRPRGCAFAPRCAQRVPACDLELPPLDAVTRSRRVRCFEWRRTAPLSLESEPLVIGREGTAISVAPLLTVESLRAEHTARHRVVVAADDVSFTIASGESVALVGESGSGKTTIARCVAGLHAPTNGRILLDGTALATRSRERPKEARQRIQIIFQSPYDSLNPRRTIGDAVARPARLFRGLDHRAAEQEAMELLERVRLPRTLFRRFPAGLSGGERQRVAIARSLAAKPDLLVCDEITSALDVSVQAAVLDLIAELRDDLGLALLFISHDLGVVASVSDRVLVLANGIVREDGPVARVLTNPSDEYTRLLVSAAPRLASHGDR